MTPLQPPIPDANAIRDFVVVRTREIGDEECVSYYAIRPDEAFAWVVRDFASVLTEEQAVALCAKRAAANRSHRIRYTVEPLVPISVTAHGLDWHLRVNPTNAAGSRLHWRADAGALQTPMRVGVNGHEWLILVTPRRCMDSDGAMWGATIYRSGTMHHGANGTPEIDRYYATAAEAMAAGATVLFALAPHLRPEDAPGTGKSALGDEIAALVGPDFTHVAATEDVDSRELLACIRALRRSPGLRAIALERGRQLDEEGYDAAHDARHGALPLLLAAIAYGQTAMGNPGFHGLGWWPWDPNQFKPTTMVRDAVKAGALDAAALDVMLATIDPGEV